MAVLYVVAVATRVRFSPTPILSFLFLLLIIFFFSGLSIAWFEANVRKEQLFDQVVQSLISSRTNTLHQIV